MELKFEEGDGVLICNFPGGKVVRFDVGEWLAKVEAIMAPYRALPAAQQTGQWIEKLREKFEAAGVPKMEGGAAVAGHIIDAMRAEDERVKKKLGISPPSAGSSGPDSTAQVTGSSPLLPGVPTPSTATG